MKVDATYRIIQFPTERGMRYVGLAWNYEEAVLLSTMAYGSYTEAKMALEARADSYLVRLRFFDGEYRHVLGELVPAPSPTMDDPQVGGAS